MSTPGGIASPQWVAPFANPTGDNSSIIWGGGGATHAWSTVNTEIAWVEIENSTNEDWQGFEIALIYSTGGAASRALVDVGIGAGGEERVIVENILVGASTGYQNATAELFVPIPVPKGSRIAMRWQGTPLFPATERPEMRIRIVGFRSLGAMPPCSRSATFLALPASSNGTAIVGGYAFGGSAWFELVASCPFDVRYAVIANLGTEGGMRIIQVGVGVSPNITPHWSGEMLNSATTPLHVNWPSGSAVHRRHFFAPDVTTAIYLFG